MDSAELFSERETFSAAARARTQSSRLWYDDNSNEKHHKLNPMKRSSWITGAMGAHFFGISSLTGLPVLLLLFFQLISRVNIFRNFGFVFFLFLFF